jgi:hypothetical protein
MPVKRFSCNRSLLKVGVTIKLVLKPLVAFSIGEAADFGVTR